MFDSLGELLIQIQLLRAEQWQEVCRDLPPNADLAAILNRIEKLSAWWSVATPRPALTPFQRKAIRQHHEGGRLPRLQRSLRRGDYLILQKLGEGGIGVVYLAWSFADQRLVAIKAIKQVSLENYRRFRREARLQKRLTHPCIARFLKLARVRGETLLVQEYIEGRTIAQEVKVRGPIPWPEAGRWMVDVLRALEYAHRLKIVHRDIKPSNIMLERDAAGMRAKLLDLGLAKCLDPTAMTQSLTQDVATVRDALLGTFDYMAPEHWRGAQDIVPASDIYSLGCTFFFALTGGRPPFQADSLLAYCNAHTNMPPPRLNTGPPALPDAVDALVQQMLSKDPAKRGSPARLLKQFSKLLRPSDAPERSRAEPVPKPRPAQAAASAPTPAPRRALELPRSGHLPLLAADERFLPFSPESPVQVWGVRSFLRALLVSRGLFQRLLLLLLLASTVAALLWLWLLP